MSKQEKIENRINDLVYQGYVKCVFLFVLLFVVIFQDTFLAKAVFTAVTFACVGTSVDIDQYVAGEKTFRFANVLLWIGFGVTLLLVYEFKHDTFSVIFTQFVVISACVVQYLKAYRPRAIKFDKWLQMSWHYIFQITMAVIILALTPLEGAPKYPLSLWMYGCAVLLTAIYATMRSRDLHLQGSWLFPTTLYFIVCINAVVGYAGDPNLNAWVVLWGSIALLIHLVVIARKEIAQVKAQIKDMDRAKYYPSYERRFV
ncbi:MAG: hypothetical protein ACPGO5_01310 [Patescibacteria group bacterium]